MLYPYIDMQPSEACRAHLPPHLAAGGMPSTSRRLQPPTVFQKHPCQSSCGAAGACTYSVLISPAVSHLSSNSSGIGNFPGEEPFSPPEIHAKFIILNTKYWQPDYLRA